MNINPGEFITIIERKCSDKIQPNIQLGGIYHVTATDRLADGTEVLIIDKDIKKKTTVRINAKRFTWHPITPKEIHDRQFAEQKSRDFTVLMSQCSRKEIQQLTIIPYVIQEIAFHYARLARQYCIDHHLKEFFDTSQKVRGLLDEHRKFLNRDLTKEQSNGIREQTKDFLEKNKNHFGLMYYTFQNELLKQNQSMTHSPLRAYSFISLVLCCELTKYEDNNQDLRKKVVGWKDDGQLPHTKDLYLYMCLYLQNLKLNNTDNISLAVRVFENNINHTDFNFA